jgi:hypothetical protein
MICCCNKVFANQWAYWSIWLFVYN